MPSLQSLAVRKLRVSYDSNNLQFLRRTVSHISMSPKSVLFRLFLRTRFLRVISATNCFKCSFSFLRSTTSWEQASRVLSLARRFLPASRKSLPQGYYRLAGIPSRRHRLEILSSPRRPLITIRIFSSEKYFLRVLRRMSLTADSLDTFLFITTSFKESLTESIS
jgi:hypothetical protein